MKRKLTGCSGKKRHATKVGAIIAAKRIKNALLSIYHCPHCKGWHLGRSNHPMKLQARLDQLLGEAEAPKDQEP